MNIDELKEKLDMYSDSYYNNSVKLVTDEEFDKLKAIYENKTKKKYQIGSKVKVNNTVDISHSYNNLAGTLDKVNTYDEFISWVNRKKLNSDKLGLSLKYDGHSIILEYTKKKLTKALTRGNGGEGKDLTEWFKNATLVNNVNLSSLDVGLLDFGVAFEAVLSYDSFDKLLKENPEVSYNNPRSAIGGILSTDGIKYAKYLSLVPLKIISKKTDLTRKQQLNIIDKISTKYNLPEFMNDELDLVDVEDIYNEIVKNRFDYEFMVDGVVIESLNEDNRKLLDFSDNRPNYAIAFKFPYIEKDTRVTGVEWFTEGNSAIYTPVVYFEPVILNGNTYKKVSLANYARFKKLNLKLLDPLIFALRKLCAAIE
jgi:DNA ligase (NAD+)